MGKLSIHLMRLLPSDVWIQTGEKIEREMLCADLRVILGRVNEKDIPFLAIYGAPDWRPVEYEMTWTELAELKTKLDKILHDHVIEGKK